MPEGGGPWPAHASFGDRGLVVAGVPAMSLAERYGTPLLIVDEEHLRDRARTFAELFPHPVFAVKAFTAHAMLRLAVEEGLDLLAATDGELEACLRAGVPGSRIMLHGNNKSDEELRLAIASRVRLVNVDNPWELERLDRIARDGGVTQPILLRVIPEVGAGAHRAIRTGGAGSKFGTPLPLVSDAIRRAQALPSIEPVGIHAHIGSQVLEVEPYLAEVDVLLDLLVRLRAETGFEADVVDVGGGFGVAYTDEAPLSLDEVAPALLARVRDGAARRGLRVPHTLVEPGRSVTGTAMLTLYRVGAVKEVRGRVIAAVDGGMSDNIRPMLYGARYTVAEAGPPRRVEPPVAVDIVGRHCESGDILASDVKLPAAPRPGDLLAFAATGAYTYSMASSYNRVGRPAVVAVRDGESRLWLRREVPADLDRLEAGSWPSKDPEIAEGVLVRPATPRDAASFLEVYREVVAEGRFLRAESTTRTVRECRRMLRRSIRGERAYLVAISDGRVVGWLSIAREQHAATRHVATFGMGVARAWRGRGVGSALVAGAIRWARDAHVDKLEISVYPDNRPALALYRGFGFVEEGLLAGHSKKSYGYVDEILMGVWVSPEDR